MDIEREALSHVVSMEGMKTLWDKGVRREHFFDPTNRGAFAFAIEYWHETHMDKTPTKESLEHEFPSLVVGEPQESAKWVSEALKKNYVRSEMQDVVRGALEASEDDPREGLRNLNQSSWNVLQSVSPRSNRSNMASSVMERRNRYVDRAQNKNAIKGVPMGLDMLDEHMSGIFPGELTVIAGYAKTGKSHFLCNAVKAARYAGWTPYFATLELSVEQMEDRMDCHVSGIGNDKHYKGNLNKQELDVLRESQDEFSELGDVFIEKPPRGERSVAAIANRARALGADFLVIDQFSFLEARHSNKEKRYEYEELMEDLKNEISEDGSNMLPTLMAVQLNRESRKAKKPGMENLAGSSAIERYCDTALGLHATEEMRVNNSMGLDILGGRRSGGGSWLLSWELGDVTEIGVREERDDD